MEDEGEDGSTYWGNDIAKLREEFDNIKQHVEQTGGQASSVETVKEVLSNLLTDPLSPVYMKAVEHQNDKMDSRVRCRRVKNKKIIKRY